MIAHESLISVMKKYFQVYVAALPDTVNLKRPLLVFWLSLET
ncbi:hypothetical protein Z949_326 [Sulfitobacter guttiformis KCTC 32187]|nr:hypothetical protein Z949_326 [Sulfitobacter guttiformis KCTC 32187]